MTAEICNLVLFIEKYIYPVKISWPKEEEKNLKFLFVCHSILYIKKSILQNVHKITK